MKYIHYLVQLIELSLQTILHLTVVGLIGLLLLIIAHKSCKSFEHKSFNNIKVTGQPELKIWYGKKSFFTV